MIITKGQESSNFYSKGKPVQKLYQKGELIWERPPADIYILKKLDSSNVYWDLGEPTNLNYKYEIECEVVDFGPVWGSRTSPGIGSYNLFSTRFDVGINGPDLAVSEYTKLLNKYTIDKGVLYINDEQVANYTEEWESLSTLGLNTYLWNINQSEEVTTFSPIASNSRMYRYRVYNEIGELIKDYYIQRDGSLKCSLTSTIIPLIADSSASYEIIGYDYLDYVTTDGSGEMYVDIPTTITQDSVITCEIHPNYEMKGEFGLFNLSNSVTFSVDYGEFGIYNYMNASFNDEIDNGYGYVSGSISRYTDFNLPIKFKISKLGLEINDQAADLFPRSDNFEISGNLRLGLGHDALRLFIGSIYNFKIENSKVVDSIELKPAMNISTGDVGFLDQNMMLLVSEGSKEFLKAEPNFVMSVVNNTEVYSSSESETVKTVIDPELVYFTDEEESENQIVIFNL